VRKIEWTPDGIESLNEILEYYKDRAGENIANSIYDKISHSQNSVSFGNGFGKTVHKASFSIKSKVDFPKAEVLENPQIIKKIDLLALEEIKTKRTQELMDIGIYDVYELVIKPWKVYYKISGDNKKAYVLFVLDGRRNLEEILMSKVIDRKL
jgi:plasmid stabilization system protein ParE